MYVDDEGLRTGLDRACDLFRLHRLSDFGEAEARAAAVFANFGVDEQKREQLVRQLQRMLPITGDPLAESLMTSAMTAGVLVGLLIADATHPAQGLVPDHPPVDL